MSGLSVRSLSKRYREKQALDDFSFGIESGEIVGLIGRNGAGKTTLLNCIAGNILPDSGEILFDMQDLIHPPCDRSAIGILIEASFVDYLSAFDNLQILMYASGSTNERRNVRLINRVLDIVDLAASKRKKVSGFSYGMKQRLGFAQALLNGRRMLVLDEPFAGLDVNGRRTVKDLIRNIVANGNVGVLFSDHNLEEVRDLCHRVICIQNGRKVYDGDMYRETVHYVKVNPVTPEMMAMLDVYGVYCEDGDTLHVNGNGNLTEIFATIARYSRIQGIETVHDSLEKFLEEDL